MQQLPNRCNYLLRFRALPICCKETKVLLPRRELWLVADTLNRTGPRSDELGTGPVHVQRVEDQTIGELKSAGVDDDLVCVKRLAHFS